MSVRELPGILSEYMANPGDMLRARTGAERASSMAEIAGQTEPP
jgi:hypothetical protein